MICKWSDERTYSFAEFYGLFSPLRRPTTIVVEGPGIADGALFRVLPLQKSVFNPVQTAVRIVGGKSFLSLLRIDVL